MGIREEHAKKYLEEAELTLISAEAIFKEAKETKKDLWAQVVKNAYDAMEHAISAALAKKDLTIPKEHPQKITRFVDSFDLRDTETEEILSSWVGRRGRAQYVDIWKGRLSVPHEIFDEWDAADILKDARKIIDFVKRLISDTV